MYLQREAAIYFLKVRFLNIGPKLVDGVTFFFENWQKCSITTGTTPPGTGKGLWQPKTTKKVVPKSDFQYISMISTDFDGIEVDFK